jgi:hypothetical protein
VLDGVEGEPSHGAGETVALKIGRQCVRVLVKADRHQQGGGEEKEGDEPLEALGQKG